MRSFMCAGVVVAAIAGVSTSASAQVLFDSGWDNGFFTPFTSSTSSSIRYGDSGWVGNGGSPAQPVSRITLQLAAFNSASAGLTDITFTFNDGDPSGQVFGPGTTLYSTTIEDVVIPASGINSVAAFDLVIDLPGVVLTSGFNNFGWSIGVQNFNYAGSMGFTCSSANSQFVGFYTNNAASYNGSSWSLFSFSGDPVFGVANLRAKLEVPSAGTLASFGIAAIPALRRRRHA